jgi:hypothetical protein
MKQAFDIKYYTQQRDALRNRFEADKTGDQTLLTEQTKLFKPLLQSQQQIQDKLIENQKATSNVLVPFVSELQKRDNLMEDSQYLPFYNDPLEIQDVSQSTPVKSKLTSSIVYIDLNQKLNETDIENLQDMSLELPSDVQKKKNYQDALNKAKSERHSIGALLGKSAKQKPSDKEIAMYESRKETLTKYKDLIKYAKISTENFQVSKKSGTGIPLCKPKRNRGRPRIRHNPIVYNNPDDLLQKLHEHLVAKEAGNTGLDNEIVSMLDELLRIKAINKDVYDNLYRNYFKI